MNNRMKIAFVCHFLAALIVIVFGNIYLFRAEFMPYHSAAIELKWTELSPSFQVLLLALMKAVGASCFAVGIYTLILLFIPFRRGEVWPRWAIPIGGLVVCAGVLYATLIVAFNTPSKPPWIAPGYNTVSS
jgi:hypothetical protein